MSRRVTFVGGSMSGNIMEVEDCSQINVPAIPRENDEVYVITKTPRGEWLAVLKEIYDRHK